METMENQKTCEHKEGKGRGPKIKKGGPVILGRLGLTKLTSNFNLQVSLV